MADRDPALMLGKALALIDDDLDRISALSKKTARVLEQQESQAVARYAGVLLDHAKDRRDAERQARRDAEDMSVEEIFKKLRKYPGARDLMDRDENQRSRPARSARKDSAE